MRTDFSITEKKSNSFVSRFKFCGAGVFALLVVMLMWALTSESSQAEKPVAAKRPASANSRNATVLYETHVKTIFKSRCVRCHNSRSRKADLDLSNLAGILKGGESGELFVAGKPEESLLYEMIHDGSMPPDDKSPITKSEIATIKKWIATGAKTLTKPSAIEQITQHDIIPLMNLRCTTCHGLRLQEAGLDLRTKASMLRGGKSGPAIVPGHPEKSLLLKRIHKLEMPPRKKLVDAGVRPMEANEIEKLTKWIAQGAPEVAIKPDIATTEPDPIVTDEDRQFWSFQPPKRPAVPHVKNTNRVRNEIDRFLLKRLEKAGLSYSPEASRLTLIRRVAYDLTGLPPTWKDVEQFLSDKSPQAYEKMVDRYLASPRYGERWGQYWLDLSGYSDSEGKRSADVVRNHAWRYRDYVIRAFNSDKPYDRFLLEQLAGDELKKYDESKPLSDEVYDNLVATGFLRMAPDGTGSDIVNTVVERMEVVADEMNVLGSAVLGLTIKCAQCHSHKYDPIPQRDYYRLVATFKGAYDVHDWLKSTSVAGQTKGKPKGRVLRLARKFEYQRWQQETKATRTKIAEENKKLSQLKKDRLKFQVAKRLAKLPEKVRTELLRLLDIPVQKRTQTQKQLATKYKKQLAINDAELKRVDAVYRKAAAASAKKIKALNAKIPAAPGIRALWDRGVPSATYIYQRGQVTKTGKLVGPGVLSVLTDGKTPFEFKPPWPGANKTGRRLAFAKWLVQPNHPLTARVMVNRIWNHHFGRGIVKTLGNFGKTGSPPTHPQLLDWLATEFIARKWSIKHMHRLMMNSSAYRQVSAVSDRLLEKDPENALVSRMPLRRMEAEVVRDAILQISGELDETPFGRPDPVTVRPDGLVVSKRGENGWRRSIYVLHRRKEMPTILENFDLPQMIPNCIERPNSTVSSQALHLMNNGMIRDLATSFANRVQKEVGNDAYRQVERVYQLALNRMPSETEKEISTQALEQLRNAWRKHLASQKPAEKDANANTKALANFCHAIINSAGFLYID